MFASPLAPPSAVRIALEIEEVAAHVIEPKRLVLRLGPRQAGRQRRQRAKDRVREMLLDAKEKVGAVDGAHVHGDAPRAARLLDQNLKMRRRIAVAVMRQLGRLSPKYPVADWHSFSLGGRRREASLSRIFGKGHAANAGFIGLGRRAR